MNADVKTLDSVKDYYGKVLGSNKDLKTSACCAAESLPPGIREIAALIHPEVTQKFFGCGCPLPPSLEGKTVLDLGCGTGRDCFIISKLVGAQGRVIGIDMTDEQLAVANRYVDHHTELFGYSRPNVEFKKGYIEDLEAAGIESNSVDLVVSNCVVNLSPDKKRVLKEVFRVLKPGGELYFSDVFANRRIPAALAQDPVLLGECLGGAMYTEDFRRHLLELGVRDFRVVFKSPIQLNNPEVEKKIGMVDFASVTIRAFKLEELEDKCEDYGQVAYYLGTVENNPHRFMLDDHHVFQTGLPMLVCSNTAFMLSKTRYAPHFKIVGDLSTHYGLFDCGPGPSVSATASSVSPGACC